MVFNFDEERCFQGKEHHAEFPADLVRLKDFIFSCSSGFIFTLLVCFIGFQVGKP